MFDITETEYVATLAHDLDAKLCDVIESTGMSIFAKCEQKMIVSPFRLHKIPCWSF